MSSSCAVSANLSYHRHCPHRPALCRHLHEASNSLKNHSFVLLWHQNCISNLSSILIRHIYGLFEANDFNKVPNVCHNINANSVGLPKLLGDTDIMVSGNQNPGKMMNSSRGFEMRTWCMCHCISVIIYSDTLMLTALARGPFTLCAFNFVRSILCVMPLHFWRDCVTGLPYTLPVVFMTSCYCKFWHINGAQTCRTPERRVLLFHS